MTPHDDLITAELLATLDALYPLPNDDKRVERAGRTSAAVQRWMSRTLERLGEDVSSALAGIARQPLDNSAEREATARRLENWAKGVCEVTGNPYGTDTWPADWLDKGGPRCCQSCWFRYIAAVLRRSAAGIARQSDDKAIPDHICGICYHPFDACSHCDKAALAAPHEADSVIRQLAKETAQKLDGSSRMEGIIEAALLHAQQVQRERDAEIVERALQRWHQGVGNISTLPATLRSPEIP